MMKEKVQPIDPFVAGIKFIEGVTSKPGKSKIPETYAPKRSIPGIKPKD